MIPAAMFAAVVLLVVAVRKRWHWALSLTFVVVLAGLLVGTPDGHTVTQSLTTFARAVGSTQ
jgi:H+/gluconate symporter-like permease